MTNKQMNGTCFEGRKEMSQLIQRYKGILEDEKFQLECYEDGTKTIDAYGRNKKGEVVRLDFMRDNIAALEAFIATLEKAQFNLTLTASIY